MGKNDTVKGFSDFIGKDARKRDKIISIIKNRFELYGYEPAETPIIEFETFAKGNNSDDSAVRDLFRLQDRGERELALRYEFTFQLKRIAKKQKIPYKRFQIGYNFRDEPIRKGRTRQFIQADADIIGSTLKDEAENFKLISEVFNELQMPVTIYVNNRKLINEILVDKNIEEKNRDNVIRIIDKLDKSSKKEVADELQQYTDEKLVEMFTGKEESFEKYSSYNEIKELQEYCRLFNVNVEFRPYLARGFSYYNGTVFEVWSKDMNVSIMGGGSYLVDKVQATGISFGIEPIFLLANTEGETIDYLVVSLDQDKEAIEVTNKLREKGNTTQLLTNKTPSKAFEYANAKDIKNVIVIGSDEVQSKKYKVKNMQSGKVTSLNM
jgi:histidyl-tRNA synthetase